jgi:hypothetical protein
VSPLAAVANPHPEVRCREGYRMSVPSTFKKLRFNHPALSKVTAVTTTHKNVNLITHDHYLRKRRIKSKILA